MIHTLLYRSRSVYPRGHISDLNILREALERNARLDVTGYLVRAGSRFAQFLEGSPEAIDELLQVIAADRRHSDFEIMQQGEIEDRLFSDWSMGYTDLNVGSDAIATATASELMQILLEASHGEAPA